MEAHQAGTIVLRAEAVFHQPIPDFAGGAVFCDLFEEVVVRVEEEAETRSEVVDVESASARPFDVFNSVVDGEGELLECSRARFANVIADRKSTRLSSHLGISYA